MWNSLLCLTMNVFKRKVLRYTLLHARRRYQIFHGDSRQQISYKNAGFGLNYLADVLITDPPYCLLTRRRKYGDIRDSSRRTRKLDNQKVVPKFESVKEYREFTSQWLSTATSALKPSAFLIIWTNFLGKEPIIKTAESLGYTKFDKEYLWCKHSSPTATVGKLSSNECLLRVYETALIFHPTKYPISALPKGMSWSVVTAYQPTEGTAAHSSIQQHPCHKPAEALIPLISCWTKSGDVVLDPFAGSGSILRTVEEAGEGRTAVGIEIVGDWTNIRSRSVC